MDISTSETILYLAAFLFCVGFTVVLTRRNLIMMLLGIELMLNAANLNLIAFGNSSENQFFILFIILVAVCEAAVGIALVLRVYHFYKTSSPDQISDLKERA
ncbi:MAG TPA: NADH-quinone oxidoreductase subunit NuoK [Cyclobacteriaceae bacterium]|nr:NADH-quinone oxidoreductase subunit NuoK [Cyclobacteriaceae bacterium]